MDLNETMPQETTDVTDKYLQSIEEIIQINVFALQIIILWRKGLKGSNYKTVMQCAEGYKGGITNVHCVLIYLPL